MSWALAAAMLGLPAAGAGCGSAATIAMDLLTQNCKQGGRAGQRLRGQRRRVDCQLCQVEDAAAVGGRERWATVDQCNSFAKKLYLSAVHAML